MGAWLLPRESSALFTLPAPRLIALGATAQLLCRANGDRIALLLMPDRAQQSLVWWGGLASPGGRWTVLPADPMLAFLHSETGPLCQQEWWGSAVTIGAALSVQEVLLERAPK